MHQLIRGDSIEILKSMKDKFFDCIVTDPPWGVGIEYGRYKDTSDSLMKIIEEAVPQMLRIAHRVIILCGTKYMHCYPRPMWTMAWVYPAGGAGCPWGFTCWQPILCYGKDPYLANRMGGRPQGNCFGLTSSGCVATNECDSWDASILRSLPCPLARPGLSRSSSIFRRSPIPGSNGG